MDCPSIALCLQWLCVCFTALHYDPCNVCLAWFQVEPVEVMRMLNELYNRYDMLCESMPVYKVSEPRGGRWAGAALWCIVWPACGSMMAPW